MKKITTNYCFVMMLMLFLSYSQISAQEVTYGLTFEVLNGTLDESSASVITDPEGVRFSDDGLTLFVLDGPNDRIVQYALGTAFEISSGLTNEGNLNVTTDEGLPLGFTFNDDGTKLYVVGAFDAAVNQYSLSSAFDVTSGVTFDGLSASFSSDEDAPTAIVFNADGSKMYISGINSGEVHQYSLTTNFDVTDGYTSDGTSFDLATTETAPEDIAFSSDGMKLFVIGSGGDEINQFSLTTAFTVTSGVSADGVLDLSAVDGEPNGMTFGRNGSSLYFVGAGNDEVYQYNLDIGGFSESGANDGSVDGSLTVKVTGETFSSAGSTLTATTDYAINNLPSGLMPTITVAADGASAVLTLAGNATNNLTFNDVTSLNFTFTDAAFTGDDVSVVSNAVAAESFVRVDFDGVPVITYGDPFLIPEEIDITSSYELPSALSNTLGVAFSNDGFKMFLLDNTTNSVHQYGLSEAFDISSTVTEEGDYLVESRDDTPTDIAFNDDGTRMFIVGTENESVYQFTLGTAFDITGSVSYNGLYVLSSRESNPTGITFNNDGTKMYIVGTNGQEVNQFRLNTAYTITGGVVHEAVESISSKETAPQSIAFNDLGDQMYIIGSIGDSLLVYDLSTDFAVTSATHAFSLGLGHDAPAGIAFSDRGDQFFVVDALADELYRYNLPAEIFEESASNDGSISGAVTITISDETFTSAGGTLTESTDYTITGIPDGLTESIAVAADGESATLTLSGNAENNSIARIADISIDFTDAAFSNFDANDIEGAANGNFEVFFNFIENPTITYGRSFDLTQGASLEGFLDAGDQENDPYGMQLSTDGSKLFIVGKQGDDVSQYSLSEAFNVITGATYDDRFRVFDQDRQVEDVVFSPDGTAMTIVGSRELNGYTLDTPFDITGTVTLDGPPEVISAQDDDPTGLAWNEDGTQLFVVGAENDKVYTYNVGLPYNVTGTFSHAGVSSDFLVRTQTSSPEGITFSADGMKMFIVDADEVFQYSLPEPYDVAGADYDDISYTLEFEQDNYAARGVAFNNDGSVFYTCDLFRGIINQYAVNPGGFIEAAANDGSVEGNLFITLEGDTFTSAGSTLTEGLNYTISGVPAGLTPVMTVAADGASVTLTFTGNATSSNVADNVDNLIFDFKNSAFTDSDVAIVVNAVTASSNIAIEFVESPPVVTSLTVPEDGEYGPGNILEFMVNYDKTVTVDESGGSPTLRVQIASNAREAAYINGSGTTSLVFRYTVQTGELDENGFSSISLQLNGSIITGPLGQDADNTLNGVPSTSGIDVDGVAPEVDAVTGPAAATYTESAVLNISVDFDERIEVDETSGSPTLDVEIGSDNIEFLLTNVNVSSGILRFSYTVADGDLDTDGITVGAINLNGSVISDEAGNAAVLTLNNVFADNNVLIDAAKPVITSVGAPNNVYTSPSGGLSFQIFFDEVVTITGTPQLTIDVGGDIITLDYTGTAVTASPIFTWIVGEDDEDLDGIEIGTLSTNGGTIQDAHGNNAILTLNSVGSTDQVIVSADEIWTGDTDTDWATASNWSRNRLPDNRNVIVLAATNSPVLDSDASINNLRIMSGGSLQVNSGKSLRIFGTVSVDGDFSIDRATTGNAGYSIVSSPVENTTVSAISPDYAYGYDGSDFVAPGLTMNAGEGYFFGFDESLPVMSFEGVPHSGDISKSVTNGNFELIGNPYTAPISISIFLNDNSSVISGTVYFWDDGGSNVGGSRGGDYVTANAMGSVSAVQPGGVDDGVAGGQGTAAAGNGAIPAVQGFFVEAIANGDVTFQQDMQVITSGVNADDNFYRQENRISSKIKLIATGKDFYDEVLIGVAVDANSERDYQYDAVKLMDDGQSGFYSLIGDERYAIQGIPSDQSSVRLQLDTKETEITLTPLLSDFEVDTEFVLKDLTNGKRYLLTDEVPVTITINSGDFSNRFELERISGKVLAADTDLPDLKVYGNTEALNIVFSGSASELVSIYSLDGKKMYHSQTDFFDQQAIINARLKAHTIYLLRVGNQSVKFILEK